MRAVAIAEDRSLVLTDVPERDLAPGEVRVEVAASGIGLGANPGAYAERVVVRADTLHRLPDGVSDEHGALVEPLAVGLHGIAVADVAPDRPVAVIGAGPIG